MSFSAVVMRGRLQNSKILKKLESHLAHLPEAQRDDIVEVIMSHKPLFSDVPARTSVLQHDIDIGDCLPIKQHAYCVNPDKWHRTIFCNTQ